MERGCARIIELEGQPDSTSRSTMIVSFVLLLDRGTIIDSCNFPLYTTSIVPSKLGGRLFLEKLQQLAEELPSVLKQGTVVGQFLFE